MTGYFGYLSEMADKIQNKAPTYYTVSAPNHLGYKARKQINNCLSAAISGKSSIVS